MKNVDPFRGNGNFSASPRYDFEGDYFGAHVHVEGPPEIVSSLKHVMPISPSRLSTGSSIDGIHADVELLSGIPDHYLVTIRGMLPTAFPYHQAIPYLEQAINAALLARLHDYYLIHAGAVAFGELGIIFPAAGGSGKTTLVAGCVAEGAKYLSDEVAVVDPVNGELVPFAKSMYVREGSRAALAEAFPTLVEESDFVQPNGERVWYLPPRPDWLPPSPTKVRAVVLPSFRHDLPTSLDPVGRPEVLRAVMEQSFNLDQHRGKGLGALIAVLGEAECYCLTYREWREAATAIRERFCR